MTDAPPDDLPKNEKEVVRQWLEAIDLSEREEKDWRDTADRACDTYRGGDGGSAGATNTNLNTFNIFHANVETVVAATYNSTPIPDVRRRFNDEDPVGKEASEIIERAIAFQIDAYDFDQTLLSAVRDMAITSRGVVRVRYEPSFDSDQSKVLYEQTTCEYVPWRSFRRGPARTWRDVPWQAFEQFLSYQEVERLLKDEKDKDKILEEMTFSYSAEPKKDAERQAENLSKIAARARVWEIWDKDARKVHFISPDYAERALTTLDDPLGLQDFFCTPRPLAAIIAPDSLIPITLLQIYEKLLEELNIVQRRIMRLTNQLRVRGWYAGLQDADIKMAATAEDGELVPLQGVEQLVTNGKGLDSAITYWPLEAIVKALNQLVEQREQIKATIYEVTGLSDIVRGATNPNETATAQQIKSQWGSLRIQKMQGEVARFARDLFRMKAEIMAGKFDFKTFELMTGLKYPTAEEKQQAQMVAQQAQAAQQPQPGQPPQPPQPLPPELEEILKKPTKEEIEQVLRNDAVRGFRVDIESDSTIRGDAQRNQEQMGLFVSGIGSYAQSVGPLVMEGAMPGDVAIEILAAFCRSFRLGKQAEDALDRWADQSKKAANQPKPPSPEEQKAKAEMAKLEADAQATREKHEMEKEKMQLGLQIEREKIELKRQEMEMKREEMVLDFQATQQKAALDRQAMEDKAQFDQVNRVADFQQAQQQRIMDSEAAQEKNELARQGMEDKAKFSKQQMRQKAAV